MDRQDLYKGTMSNAANFFRGQHTSKWAFKNRGPQKLGCLAEPLRKAFKVVNDKANVPLTVKPEDIPFLQNLSFGRQQIDKWASLHTKKNDMIVNATETDDLNCRVFGPWGEATMFELPILGETQEQWSIHNNWIDDKAILEEGRKRLRAKVALYNTLPKGECLFVEMGTRRAFSRAWHREVVEYLAANLQNFGGTSNIGVARQIGAKCVGTQAHEWFQAGQVLSPSLSNVNGFMLRVWHDVYGGTMGMKYGIALTDCTTTDVFLREFNVFLSNVFDGCRHDSGCPFAWGDKLLAHYKKHGIDPEKKIVVFSNSLNPEMVMKIFHYFRGKFGMIVFGIGTDFTHDLGVKGLNMVMKMIEFDGLPVAKISDDAGKGMCEDPAYVDYLKLVNGIK